MKKNSTDKLEVKGTMSENGADKVGLIQAKAVYVFAILVGLSTLVAALSLWL
ncbi:hypothetical protein [Pseudoalteromonas umbrosa]|uniref:hypothetical protein n=1 Tax=Pseudoalteromonas umbrosa TaxID=3048489 RepID=UPI0024C3AE37|nr:hypothetical protein [Pseudoalteromonas sp. B95]MDK1286306.1 hypothetical protein [Pseudoalteromonas sp. B95]